MKARQTAGLAVSIFLSVSQAVSSAHLYCYYSTILLTVWIGPQLFALVTQIPFFEVDA